MARIITYVFGIIVILGIYYALTNSTTITALFKGMQIGQLSAVNNCTSDINSVARIFLAKLPSDASTSIVNVTTFQNSPSLSSDINSWATYWNMGFNCPDSFNAAYCNDENRIVSLSVSYPQNKTMAIGIVLKVTVPSINFANTYPLLCNAYGTLLNGSLSNEKSI